ncbi:hypothetical protein CHU32_09390 [Superficieibacter electus]|uniref:Uncharacterized protein n=1 Tax=Superficieibacter electus TaxID=2022662 RepID=A0A2P5GRX9_9ENTR|nr:hypothetical protein CHU33_07845 [Superficieibacter electus]POP49307.1 hypothetical protein CHU32_09390 [Superficieibacter electus]
MDENQTASGLALALFCPVALRLPGLQYGHRFARWRCAYQAYGTGIALPGGAALTRPTVRASLCPVALRLPGLQYGHRFARWRCAYQAYSTGIALPGGAALTRLRYWHRFVR